MTTVLHQALSVLRLNQVKQQTGMSRSLIYKLMSEGKFPKQIRLGSRSVGWFQHSINDWLANRANASAK